MNEETIIAVYDTDAHAEAAVRDLEAANVPSSAIAHHNSAGTLGMTTPGSGAREDTFQTQPGITAGQAAPRERGFWSSLFGGDPHDDTAVYDRSIAAGGAVVSVRVASDQAARVSSILERHNPIDIDERAASHGLTGAGTDRSMSGRGAGTVGAGTVQAGADEVIPLAEDRLSVGKRLVNRGTTRIRRFVVETPVEENVALHSEHVSIDRRPATGDARVADNAFTDRVVEVTESDEEAVVGKSAHVREEVVVRKTADDRSETVRDTVRREDVEIDKNGTARKDAGTRARQTTPAV